MVSDDGKQVTFKICPDIKFHSGNPLTAQGCRVLAATRRQAQSVARLILTQFGFTPENVAETIKATDDHTVVLDARQALCAHFPALLPDRGRRLVVDRNLALEHEKDGDMGHEWLKTNSAGSGPFKLRAWKPNESVALDGNPDYCAARPSSPASSPPYPRAGDPAPAAREGRHRHRPQAVARGPGGGGVEPGHRDHQATQGHLRYLGLNQKNPNLAKPEVREAMKYLVDYDGIGMSSSRAARRTTSVPARGLPRCDRHTPYKLDVAKAKELLAAAGLPDGFKVTMDTATTRQARTSPRRSRRLWPKAGIDIEIIPADNKQTLTKYRARQHDIYIGGVGPRLPGPAHQRGDVCARIPIMRTRRSRSPWPGATPGTSRT